MAECELCKKHFRRGRLSRAKQCPDCRFRKEKWDNIRLYHSRKAKEKEAQKDATRKM